MPAKEIIYDRLGSFDLGMNSGVDPLKLKPSQMAYALNGTVRGDFFRTRPANRQITLTFISSIGYSAIQCQANFQTGLYQGACYYVPDSQLGGSTLAEGGNGTIVLAIAGNLFQITPDPIGGATVAQINGLATDISPPGAPTGLSAVGGSSQVSLSWTAVSGSGITYQVYRGAASGGPYSPIGSPVSVTSYTDNSVSNGTAYYYVVAAINSSESGNYSNQATATPALSVPGPFSWISATAGNLEIQLSWGASVGAATYSVYMGTMAGQEIGTAIVTGLTSPTYLKTGLTNGTQYFFTVKAINTSGSTFAASPAEISATPTSATITPPVQSTPTFTGGSNPGYTQLNWATVTGALTYSVYRGTTSGGESGTAIATGITTNYYVDETPAAGSTYYYTIKAVGTTSTSASSNEWGVTFGANIASGTTYTAESYVNLTIAASQAYVVQLNGGSTFWTTTNGAIYSYASGYIPPANTWTTLQVQGPANQSCADVVCTVTVINS
jgi:fibronectin type 3 domain-containing protein